MSKFLAVNILIHDRNIVITIIPITNIALVRELSEAALAPDNLMTPTTNIGGIATITSRNTMLYSTSKTKAITLCIHE